MSEINEELGVTDSLLYRRGNFNGTFDDLICNALLQERDSEIALSPGFRWGATLLPGQKITSDTVYSQTAIHDLTHLKTGELIESKKKYVVSGWASVNPGTEGPPIYEVVKDYIRREKEIKLPQNNNIKVE